jgi:nucleotide-binding universal stress UspA family protein
MKVIVSADGGAEGRAARRWCVEHLTPTDEVVAVLGVDSLSEAVLSVSPFLAVADPDTLREGVERRFRADLERRGVRCRAQVSPRSQAAAVFETARAEHADAIVVGKRPHGVVGDAMRNETAGHLIHRPPCPVIVVPTAAPADPADATTAPQSSTRRP